MERPQVADGGTASIWRLAANILKKQSRTDDKGWSSIYGGWARYTQLLTIKTYQVTKYSKGMPRTWTDTLVRHKQRKRNMRFGTWNVRSLYRVGWFTEAARELARYKLDLVNVQVRWDSGGTVRAGIIIFYGKGNENHQL